jgi:hypothetical protein
LPPPPPPAAVLALRLGRRFGGPARKGEEAESSAPARPLRRPHPAGLRGAPSPPHLARPFNPAKQSRWKTAAPRPSLLLFTRSFQGIKPDSILPRSWRSLGPAGQAAQAGWGRGRGRGRGRGPLEPTETEGLGVVDLGRAGACLPGARVLGRISRINRNFPETEICGAQSLSRE